MMPVHIKMIQVDVEAPFIVVGVDTDNDVSFLNTLFVENVDVLLVGKGFIGSAFWKYWLASRRS